MFPKEAVTTLITELNGRIPPPVHTAGIEEERPIPAVLIDGVDLRNLNVHNENYAGSKFDSTTGHEVAQIKRFYYTLRFDLVVRDDSETGAYDILTHLQSALANLSEKPWETFHPDVNEIRLLSSGSVSYTFNEPAETEIHQAFELVSFFETTDDNLDVIESFSDSIEIS
ncbi:tail tube protein [Halorubrum tailed phage 8]|uniref:Tail tube n=3 Tax=Haloferacalesvirus TaxID=2843389 RepID=R4TEY7_9CAUD|nr:tail tube protein [Halorubrum tailed phage 8]UBF19091.1 SPP1 gp17-like tail completion protein [Halorubrum phage HRTV-14]UBF19217.1 SPP1 gp17-like tail completion protein [Halorubrum phage HRTV-17]UBF19344.1 SPP1 gp17-like tail completion protein [Halorubrum virus HRTV-19]UBF19473.1 SPP1 gp17-like tail completion protein [Halorubrum virus HRTV-23]AGM10766.1 tail tube [Halorubrum tailed phage 8]